jgi:PAS domain-containing protein
MDEEADYYRSVLDNLTGGFMSIDLAGNLVYGNSTAGRILHIPMPAVIDKPYAAVLEPYPALCELIRETLETKRTVLRAEVTVLHGESEIIIGYSTLRVINRQGQLLGIGIIFQNLTMVASREVPSGSAT